MKLLVLLFSLRLSTAWMNYEYNVPSLFDYTGFSGCGSNGWLCRQKKNDLEVILDCSRSTQEVRIWLWTARLPSRTTIFTVMNCASVQVHIDCTSGERSSDLQEFNIFNSSVVSFLKPTPRGRYLHDNVESPLLPKSIHIENVHKIETFNGLFSKLDSQCPNVKNELNENDLTNFTLSNADLEKLPQELKFENINQLLFKNVVIRSLESKAITMIANNVIIMGSTFPALPINAIQLFVKEKALITNNTFREIQTNGITVVSKIFQFNGNYVEEIQVFGLNISGLKIEFTRNHLAHMDSRALEKITLAFIPSTLIPATKFKYTFSGNVVKNMDPGSLHPNWDNFKDYCYDLVFENNEFNCSCTHVGWLSTPDGMGPKLKNSLPFYKLYLNSSSNRCSNIRGCSLPTVLSHIYDICLNKTTLTDVCANSTVQQSDDRKINANSTVQQSDDRKINTTSVQTPNLSSPLNEGTSLTPPSQETITNVVKEESDANNYLDVKWKSDPLLSYSENPSTESEHSKIILWLALGLLIFIICVIQLGILKWWYTRNNNRQIFTTMYKNHKETESDNLIVINEHNNQLFNELNEIQDQ